MPFNQGDAYGNFAHLIAIAPPWYFGSMQPPFKYTAVVGLEDDGFWAEVPALLGVCVTGDTFEEVTIAVRELTALWLAACQELEVPIPPDVETQGPVLMTLSITEDELLAAGGKFGLRDTTLIITEIFSDRGYLFKVHSQLQELTAARGRQDLMTAA